MANAGRAWKSSYLYVWCTGQSSCAPQCAGGGHRGGVAGQGGRVSTGTHSGGMLGVWEERKGCLTVSSDGVMRKGSAMRD